MSPPPALLRRPPRLAPAQVVASLASLAGLVALVAGVPVVLGTLVGWPLPRSLPRWDAVGQALSGTELPDAVLVKGAALVVWAAWAVVVACVVLEVAAWARDRSPTRLPALGPVQIWVGRWVGSALLVASSLGATARPALAEPSARSAVAVQPVNSPEPSPAPSASPPTAPGPAAPAGGAGLKHYRVRPPDGRHRDSLWRIAERHLGDPLRYGEIFELNRGRPDASGWVLSDPHWVHPGQELLMPADAVGLDAAGPAVAPSEVAFPTGTPESHTVRPGDSLASIAAQHLGDADAWPRLYEVNRGRQQHDGRAFEDPDLIRPGWVLDLSTPSDPDAAVPSPTGSSSLPSGQSTATPPSPAEPDPVPAEPDPVTPPPTSVASAPLWEPRRETAAPGPAAAPQTTAPEATTPETTAREGARTAPVDGGSRHRLPLAVLGIPLMAAGGVVLALTRLRRVQMARRRPGRDISRPGQELESVERRLRAIGAEEAAEWLDAALRYLVASLRSSSVIPEIVCVRVGDFGVEFLLREGLGEPPSGFETADDAHVWRLDGATELSTLRRLGAEHAPATPALVSLGSSPEGPVMVNLEGLGVTSVEGPPERVGAFLAGLALELAVAPWAHGVELRLLGEHLPDLAGLEEVRRVGSVDELAAELAEARGLAAHLLDGTTSPLGARAGGSGEDVLPMVVVAGPGVSGDELEALAAEAGPGVAVVAAGPIASAPWRVMIAPNGAAVLEPIGLRVQASGVDRPPEASSTAPVVAVDQSALDAEEVGDAARLVAVAADGGDVAPVVDLEVRPKAPTTAEASHDVMVRVLGPVEIDDWALPIGRHRHLAELVAYLATHDGPVSGEALRCACWSTDIGYDTFKQTMSRARKHLGTDTEGRPHLAHAEAGSYRLGPGVGCDWVIFQGLVRSAERAAPPEAIDLYRRALELVRGEPFAHVAPQTYVWVWSENVLAYEMGRVIGDAAARLAELSLARADADTASWATRQGLLATPAQLSLFEMEMRAAAVRRDLDGLNRGFNALHKAHTAIDPLGEVPAATVALYRHLRAEVDGGRMTVEAH